MFLRRVQVSNFRVLKDVDLTFEPEFNPRIFPLGSLNGGGKSTLLQLIFILLSCSGDPEKHCFIQNMLENFALDKGDNQKLLAAIHLLHKGSEIKLDFYCHKNKTDAERSKSEKKDRESEEAAIDFSIIGKDKKLNQDISKLEDELESLRVKINKLELIYSIENTEKRQRAIQQELNNIKYGSLGFLVSKILKINRNARNTSIDLSELDVVTENVFEAYRVYEEDIESKKLDMEKLELRIREIFEHLENNNFVHICNFHDPEKDGASYALLCSGNYLNTIETQNLLSQLVNKVFLSAPFTQIFLFASRSSSKLLFEDGDNKYAYYSKINDIKKSLPNFFTYDLLSVDYILDSFKEARDKDFEKAIQSGEYGNSYKRLLNELNMLLGNKKVNINADLSGVNFKADKNGIAKELYPEDLSHGELKRLSIYVWLKYRQIKDCIVLMDEIENAFHPDWQYQIISDLAEWGASNQYILATHSYELCQALTPAHVKELEPKLLASDVENN